MRRSSTRKKASRASIAVLKNLRTIARIEHGMSVTRAAIAEAETAIAEARAAGANWAEKLADQLIVEKARFQQFEIDLAEAKIAAGIEPEPIAQPREHVGRTIAAIMDAHLSAIGLDRLAP